MAFLLPVFYFITYSSASKWLLFSISAQSQMRNWLNFIINSNPIYEMAKTMKPKKEKVIEPFFKELVEVYFSFCRDKFQENPSFDGSAPRDLKSIVISLHERALKSGIEWTLDVAQFRFKNFLDFAWQNNWLREHWLLFNINRQKDTIFFNIRKAINRTPVDPFQ